MLRFIVRFNPAPHTIPILLGLATLMISALGCGPSGPERAPIKGRITLGSAPLAAGQILFVPQAPTAGPTTSAAIKNGEYSLTKEQGPIVGTHRIEVEADLPLGFPIDDDVAFAQRNGRPLPTNPVPRQYNRESTLTFEVKPKIENVFELHVPAAR